MICISEFISETMPLLAEELKIINDTAGHFIRYLSLNVLMDERTGSKIQDIRWDLIDKILMSPGK